MHFVIFFFILMLGFLKSWHLTVMSDETQCFPVGMFVASCVSPLLPSRSVSEGIGVFPPLLLILFSLGRTTT